MSQDSYSNASLWRDRPEAWREVLPGVQRRILAHAATGLMVLYRIQPGKTFPLHNHPHAQFGVFIEGGGVFKVGDSDWKIKSGDSYFIPPGIFHELKTDPTTVSVVIDFFTPERADYVKESLPPDLL
jgi:quercetin dioxygenase-like cupin family protein